MTPSIHTSAGTFKLHNDHNVYICGAGLSVDGGVPTVPEFFLKMRDAYDWLMSHRRIPEARAIQDVISFRIASSAAGYWTKVNLENIEELFSLAAASSQPELLAKIPVAISATIDFSRQTLSKRRITTQTRQPVAKPFPGLTQEPGAPEGLQNWSIERYTHHVGKLLGVFDKGEPQGENTFITFNYDTLIEEGLVGLKVPFTYSLARAKANYDKSNHSVRPGEANIRVLKLHGSVNWAPKKDGKGRKFTVFGSYDDVRTKELTPSIVPPTWQKDLSGPLVEVWDEAVKAIGTATRLIIIGFSIPKTDTHFKYLVSAGLRQNASLRSIHVVDPDEGNCIQGRVVEFIPDDFIGRRILNFHKAGFRNFTSQQGSASVSNVGRDWNSNMFQGWGG